MVRVYGPVNSWRLGKSFGVDIVGPPKMCNYDCVYCQLGRGGILTDRPRYMGHKEKVMEEFKKKIKGFENKIDYITFSGHGEPTLNLELGQIAREIREIIDKPIAVLTNAGLVGHEEVMDNLNQCDLVIAKVDAGSERMFHMINENVGKEGMFSIASGIRDITAKKAIQTMIMQGAYDNSTPEEVGKLIELYRFIRPSEIQINTPSRATFTPGVIAASEEDLLKIARRVEIETGIKTVYFKEEYRQMKHDSEGRY